MCGNAELINRVEMDCLITPRERTGGDHSCFIELALMARDNLIEATGFILVNICFLYF